MYTGMSGANRNRRQPAKGAGGRPGRLLASLAVIIIGLVATMFGTGYHKPRLATDLAGGTSVTLTAKPQPGQKVTADEMNQAQEILRLRIDGFGVSEATVSKEGSSNIDVEVPGKNQQDIVQKIGQTAQMTFRQVLTGSSGGAGLPTTPPSPTPSSTGTSKPSSTPSSTSHPSSTPSSSSPSPSATQHDVVNNALKQATTPTSSASPGASSGAGSSSATPPTPPTAPAPPPGTTQAAWTAEWPKAWATLWAKFYNLNCNDPKQRSAGNDTIATQYMVACQQDGTAKYLLQPSEVDGKNISSASATAATTSQGTVTGAWYVNLTFNSVGTQQFAKATQEVAAKGPNAQFAIVLDGVVYSAPTLQNGAITGGQAQITGNFSAKTAKDLATVLKYGSLPLQFEQSQVSTISATVGGQQLSGGLIAGAIGLFLVVLYVLLYYRGLAVVAVTSLGIAAVITYSCATLLGPLIGFTLSLAGVAGLIVAIGITADSFVVFFERLRDEVREGRSARTAVQHGWERARRTILSADFVSFLAAAVLYIVSVGTVRGFAFTLGLTTLVDVLVVFMFTKPLITLLARTRFFGDGHPWSGLNAERLGARRKPPAKRAPIVSRRPTGDASSEGTVEA